MPSGQALLIVGGRDLILDVSTMTARRFAESLTELGYEVVQANAYDHLTPYLDAAELAMPLVFDPIAAAPILALLESEGTPFVGSPYGVHALAAEKSIARTVLAQHEIAVPNGFVVTAHSLLHMDAWPSVRSAADHLGYPLVVKPAIGWLAAGLSVVDGASELSAALADAMRFCDRVLVEEYVAGREFIATLAGTGLRPLPLVEVTSGHRAFDFPARARPLAALLQCPVELGEADTTALVDVAQRATAAIGARDFVRVEMILSATGPVVLEVVPSPAVYTGGSADLAVQTAGAGYAALVEEMIASVAARRGTSALGQRKRLGPSTAVETGIVRSASASPFKRGRSLIEPPFLGGNNSAS